MQHLLNYNNYLLQETIKWFENELLIINESKDTNKLKDLWNKISSKAKSLNKNNKTKLYSYTLAALMGIYSYNEIKNIISNDPIAVSELNNLTFDDELEYEFEPIDNYFKTINKLNNKIDNINIDDIVKEIEEIEETEDNKEIDKNKEYKNPTQMKVSSNGRKMIKWHEGSAKEKGEPVLTAYKLGDGMITIGWGHAEPKRKSKFKVGEKITREKAQELFQQDLQFNADAIRRIFKNWEEKGIYVKLTQDQFDALVSLSFNAGIGNVRMSNFIQSIKRNNFKKAGEQILKFKTSNKFEGLAERRKDEAKPFLEQ